LASGSIRCWGQNASGQVSPGSDCSGNICPTPVTVPGITNAIAVSAGDDHSCALLATGTVTCWGDNQFGQLGNGTFTPSLVPVVVTGIADAVSLSAGVGDSCAVLATGSITCWGANFTGQLGTGTITRAEPLPVQVHGITTAQAISAGDLTSCAVLTSGATYCWGDNGNGQLGNGMDTRKPTPTPVGVVGLGAAAQVSVGPAHDHACALLRSGGMACWGDGPQGQLGDGETTSSSTPVGVVGLP
jgi:alpha-tubulin suppressor-like RCC1 family protein